MECRKNRLAALVLMMVLVVLGCSTEEVANGDGSSGGDADADADTDADTDTDTNDGTGNDNGTDSTGDVAPLRIEAECGFGADAGDCNGVVDGFNVALPGQDGADAIPLLKETEGVVGYFYAGAWLAFPDVDLTGYTAVALRVASANNGGEFEVRLDAADGELIATIPVPNTGDWSVFERVEVNLAAVEGVHTIYLVSADNGSYNGDVDWIEFLVSNGSSDTGMDSDTGNDTGTAVDTDTGAVCDLPGSFSWTSTGPLIYPKNVSGHDFISIKDPSIVQYEGTYHVFATAYDDAYRSVYFNFDDFSQANNATQTYMGNWSTGNTIAPQVFYFAPDDLWYLIYQWGARYSTNPDINNPNGWSAPKSLLDGEPNGSLDFWVICDDANCSLFFSRDDGVLYRSKTSIDNFPNFSGYEIVMQEANAGDLFEASNVYKVRGQDKYLLMVECYGPRYFRSWTASSLDGPWQPLADTQQEPLAGAANVTWPDGQWTDDISHGEMVRSGYDEKMEIDACNLQFLYQGYDPDVSVEKYDLTPYRLGLLTMNN